MSARRRLPSAVMLTIGSRIPGSDSRNAVNFFFHGLDSFHCIADVFNAGSINASGRKSESEYFSLVTGFAILGLPRASPDQFPLACSNFRSTQSRYVFCPACGFAPIPHSTDPVYRIFSRANRVTVLGPLPVFGSRVNHFGDSCGSLGRHLN